MVIAHDKSLFLTSDMEVFAVPLDSTTPVVLTDSLSIAGPLGGIVADSTTETVYFAGQYVYRISVSGGTPAKLENSRTKYGTKTGGVALYQPGGVYYFGTEQGLYMASLNGVDSAQIVTDGMHAVAMSVDFVHNRIYGATDLGVEVFDINTNTSHVIASLNNHGYGGYGDGSVRVKSIAYAEDDDSFYCCVVYTDVVFGILIGSIVKARYGVPDTYELMYQYHDESCNGVAYFQGSLYYIVGHNEVYKDGKIYLTKSSFPNEVVLNLDQLSSA